MKLGLVKISRLSVDGNGIAALILMLLLVAI
jgi:hypothetical protein